MKKSKAGFSLVEIIVATSMLSLVMVMMFNLFPTSLLTIRQAEHRVNAANFAQQVIEAQRARSFADILNKSMGTTAMYSKNQGVDGCWYISDLVVTTETPPLTNPPHLLVITVNEYWNEKNENPSLASYQSWHMLQAQTNVVDIKL